MNRKALFIIITILIPILFFVLLEFFLRLVGVGDPYDLFIADGDRWQINRNVASKYFTQRDIAIPELIEQNFSQKKDTSTFRILCLGGSTTAGFPYEVNINFPYFIKTRLNYLYSDKSFEVINLGISAVNSFTVLDLAPQMKVVNPDLILIYMGHNEFYGAFGVASSEYTSLNRSFIKFTLALRQVRLYQILSNLYQALLPDKEGERGGLMQEMIAQHLIDRESEEFKGTLVNFEENLKEIFEIFEKDKIPVIIGTVVSNLAGQPPLQDLASGNVNPSEAMLKYRKGREYFDAGDLENARIFLTEARDLDRMRFRAPSEMNPIILKTAQNFRIPIAEVEALFIRSSQNRVPGNELFLEHLHPNPSGYMLIARAFVEAISKTNMLPKSRMLPQPERGYLTAAGFTLLDQVIGDLKIEQLVKEYPFNGRSEFKPIEIEDKKIREIALEHVKKKILWDEAHYRLGDQYLNENEPYKALAEYRAVSIAFPDLFTPYYKVGKVAVAVENYYQAERNYKKAIDINPDGHFLYAKLGVVLIARKKFEEAQDTLEKLIEKENVKSTLSDQEMIEVRYLLGLAYAQNKQLERAKEVLVQVLAESPGHTKAKDLLRQIEVYKGDE